MDPFAPLAFASRGRRSPRLCLLGAGLCLLLLAGPAAGQMVISEIAVTSGPEYDGGVFKGFFVAPFAFGSGIATVRVISQSGTLNQALFEVTPDEFICDEGIPGDPCLNFASLADITALGDLTFDFAGDLGEVDSVTIPLADYDPGAGQSGFPAVLSPANFQTGVATNATLQWSTPPSWVTLLAVGLEDLATGVTEDDDAFVGSPPGATVTTTTWNPAGLTNGEAYLFEISFLEPYFIDDPRETVGRLPFLFASAFESYNQSFFAVPEPSFALSAMLGSLAVAGLARRRRRSSCPNV